MLQQRIPRNARCLCGSGKKFKYCCLRNQPASAGRSRPTAPHSPRDGISRIPYDPPDARARATISTPVEKREWQQVHLVLDEPDGKQVYAVVLHSKEWLQLHRVVVGGSVHVNLPQHGARGEGWVHGIEPSPMIPDGEGRVMTFLRRWKPDRCAKAVAASPSPDGHTRRTYFGEKRPPRGYDGMRVSFITREGAKLDLILIRSETWWQANEDLLKQLENEEEVVADLADWRLVRIIAETTEGKQVHVASFWTIKWVQVHGLTVGESLTLHWPKEQLHGEGTVVSIDPAPYIPRKGEPIGWTFTSGEDTQRQGEKARLSSFEVGDHVTTYTREERGQDSVGGETCELAVLQRVRLLLKKESGGEVAVVLLRSAEWVKVEGAVPGRSIRLDMPEMGVMGWAEVQALDPLVVFRESGSSPTRLVTGTFRHTDGYPGDLKVKGEPEPIGVTDAHLFWSVDRQDWVQVGELKPGETIKTVKGTTTVESYTIGEKPELVYNLEVDGDHVFRVGEQGILVHNTSAGATSPSTAATAGLPPQPGDPVCDPCQVQAERKPVTVNRRTFDVESFKIPRGKHSHVCRVWSADGPIYDGPSEERNHNFQTDMRDFLLGTPGSPLASAYQAGHVIPHGLAGPSVPENLVPLTNTLNQNALAAFELFVKRCLRETGRLGLKDARMKVTVDYNTNARGTYKYIPTRLSYEVYFPPAHLERGFGEIKYRQVFENRVYGSGEVSFKDRQC